MPENFIISSQRMNKKLNIVVIANWAQGQALSGGDRIFIELAKRWREESSVNIHLLISQEGWDMCKRSEMTECNHTIWSSSRVEDRGMLLKFVVRTLRSIFKAMRYNFAEKTVVYSSSDFWPDSIPAFIMKLRNRNIKWIAGFYMFAPKHWQTSPYKGKRLIVGLFYWLTQMPIYWLVKRFADMVFVTSEPDVEKFITKRRGRDKIVVVRGGVDIKTSEGYLKSGKIIPVEEKKYDACFVGRFHPQKGVLELINIWELVCKKKPNAKLSMIGRGPLEADVKTKIDKLGLGNNIELLGFKDGNEKHEVFKQSKIVVHPATYDSGGMAACEAMAWGLPGVSFDLEALKTYYPKGMLKTQCFNLEKFAENIIRLIKDKELYGETKEEAIAWAKEWDWDRRAEDILKQIRAVCV